MLRFFLGRLAVLIPTFIGVSIIAFSFIRLLPGDPVALLSGERVMSPERHAEISQHLGYDRPMVIQYLDYLKGILTGDFGTSIVTKQPVLDQFFDAVSGDPGTVALRHRVRHRARHSGRHLRRASSAAPSSTRPSWARRLIGYSMPIFWWGLLLIILFSGILQWTPVSGRISLMYFFPPVTGFMLIDSLISGQAGAFKSAVSHLILPTIVLGTIPLAVIARQTRSAMLEVLGEDYVRTARAKGLSPFRVVGIHALRNAMIPVVTTIGLQVGVMLAGAILTETIFSWPGIGKWMVDSVFRRDYPVIQGGLLLIAGDHHDRQSHRRSALWADQPAHPALRRQIMADTTAIETVSLDPSRRARLAEFWYYFSENRGAVIGLWVFVLLVIVAILRAGDRAASALRAVSRRGAFAAILGGGRPRGLSARHRRRRPRHALAAALRRALLAVHRRHRDLDRAGRRHIRRRHRRLFRRLGRHRDHARHGRHPGVPLAASGAGAGRGARPRTDQRHDCHRARAAAAFRAPDARGGDVGKEPGLCDGGAASPAQGRCG